MTTSNSVGVRTTVPRPAPDPLEQLLAAEAALADEYELAHREARQLLDEARERAASIERAFAARGDAERRRIAGMLDAERTAALDTLDAATRRETAAFVLDDARVAALAATVVEALLEELRVEAAP